MEWLTRKGPLRESGCGRGPGGKGKTPGFLCCVNENGTFLVCTGQADRVS